MKILTVALIQIFFLCLAGTSSGQERFEFKSGNSSHDSDIDFVAGKPVTKPYVVKLVYKLEQTDKKKKKSKKELTNELSIEINQLNEIWIYGFGELDGQYNFISKLGDNREVLVEWVPASIVSSNTIPAKTKSASLSVSYFRDKTEKFDADLNGDIEINFVNGDNQKEYTYKIKYSSNRTFEISILKNGKPMVLNPNSERRSKNSKILGEILKISSREGF